ncbi:MAG: hypothetical protein U0Q12_14830 [Vicinamibacterales bacterium]
MTRGAWLSTSLSRFVHGDTFVLVVAPAIADLQHEAPGASWGLRLEGYLAVGRAVAGGVRRDIAGDARLVANDLRLLVGLGLLQAMYHCAILTVVLDHLSGEAGCLLVLAVSTLCLTGTFVAFWPTRRPAATIAEPAAGAEVSHA